MQVCGYYETYLCEIYEPGRIKILDHVVGSDKVDKVQVCGYYETYLCEIYEPNGLRSLTIS